MPGEKKCQDSNIIGLERRKKHESKDLKNDLEINIEEGKISIEICEI